MNNPAISLPEAQRSCLITKILGLFLGLSIWTLATQAEEGRLRFEHLSVEDGLSQSTVWDIYQDRFGFLWFATADGLNRYDGYTFRILKNDPDDPSTLAENEVFRLHEDRQGAIWLGTRNNGIDHLDRTQNLVTHYPHEPENPNTVTDGLVLSFAEDRQGTLWVGTAQGLCRIESGSGSITRFQHDPGNPNSLASNGVRAILEDRFGTLWIGTTGGGLDRYDPEQDAFIHHRHEPKNPHSLSHDTIFDLIEDISGNLWIASADGLDRYDRDNHRFENFLADRPESGVERSVWNLATRQHGGVWAGTPTGLLRIDPSRHRVTHFKHDPNDPQGLTSDEILSVYEDRSGILWVGSHDGIDKYDPRHEQFTTWRHRPGDLQGLSGKVVLSLIEDRDGGLWAGTLDDGITYLNREQGTTVQLRPDPSNPHSLPHGLVRDLLEDPEGDLWAATGHGLARLKRSQGPDSSSPFITYHHEVSNPQSLSSDVLSSLWLDPSGNLWVGNFTAGVDLFSPEQERVIDHYGHDSEDPSSLVDDGVYDILLDHLGTLWVATDHGLSRLDHGSDSFVNYVHERDNRDSLSHNSAVALYEDSQGTLWVGTYGGGLNRFHREDQKFTHYREKDGLQNDAAIAITEDEQGDLWIGTNKGLSRFDPRSETFRGYDSTDGVAGDVFGIGAAFRSSSGELFFGSGGVTAFFPNRLVDDPVPPTVVLTDFHLFYEPVPLTRSAPDSPLKQDILFTDSLTLNHRQYVFALEFAGLHFAEPGKNRYAYQLENFDAGWVETDSRNRRIQYSNLKPGNYTFRVRASNKDGKWNDRGAALQITVLPPPWKTWWAMGLYALTLALALGSSLRWQQRRVERERKISARLREVDRLKDEFLANTSHELRTPLYGIIGLAEALSEGVAGKMSSKALSHLEMVVASGRRLTGLVNDILDFSRLSHKSLDLDRQAVDLNTLTDVVLTLSQPLVGTKKLTLNNAIAPRLPAADADENRVQQILLNLVSNAIKFTTEGHIEISAMAEEGRLEIRVKDTGIGISETDLDRIFESFEQVDSAIERAHGGTGLGLAVARQLVSLHGGNLWVESALGSGSTFFFTLPLSADQTPFKFREQSSEEIFLDLLNNEQEAARSNDSAPPRPSGEVPSLPHTSLPEGEPQTSDKTDDHCILVVDDEPVIREVLVASLTAEGYRVLSVSSGLEALRLLAEAEVDLILLDVMMPQMSGYKVCRAIRRQHSLEDLPIIFLTARTQVDDMLAGFSEGANDYLAKPIARGELVARVKTHLKLYDQHRKRAARMKVLRGLLPICGGCKKIRDDDGYWNELESYLEIHSEAQLSHGLCPDCVHDLYPGVDVGVQPQPNKPVK